MPPQLYTEGCMLLSGRQSDYRYVSRALEQLEAQEHEDEEPAWELPEEYRSFQGEDGDRKALLLWRQEQQAAKQVLLVLL